MTWTQECERYPYQVVLAPGCHSRPHNPLVSRHRTLAAAVRRAMQSDRLRVEPATHAVCLFQGRSRQLHPQYGYGLYGERHVGSFRDALAEAAAAERAYKAPSR
jgi:hypothetical protein